MINDKIALYGMTSRTPVREVFDTAFRILRETDGRLGISTVENGRPRSRVISLQQFSDGNVYLMTSRGKPFYRQLKENPYIAAAGLLGDRTHSIRIECEVEEVTDPGPIKEYEDNNPGTMRMYRNNTDLIALFLLKKGTLEVFHLYRDDMVRRLRIGFGGAEPEPLSYYTTDACIGCGACADSCAEQSIDCGPDGKYHIRSLDCDDCGICYTKCPLPGVAMINRNEL